MASEAAPSMTPFEMAIALRQAGIHVPPHPKAGTGLGASDEVRIPAETFLMECEAWKAAVEEAHRNWEAGQLGGRAASLVSLSLGPARVARAASGMLEARA